MPKDLDGRVKQLWESAFKCVLTFISITIWIRISSILVRVVTTLEGAVRGIESIEEVIK